MNRLRDSLIAGGAGLFVANTGYNADWQPDLKALYVFAGALAGAGIGVAVGGPLGALLGGALGAVVGVAAAVASEEHYEVVFEVDAKGQLRIHLKKKPGHRQK